MKVLGIEIWGRDVRIVALEKKGTDIIDYTAKYKPIALEDDETSNNVILFKNTLFSVFDNFAPNEIVIKYRNPKGKGVHAPSPISFKIEGLIQIYSEARVSFVNPITLSAYYKKNKLELKPSYSYQNDAMRIAYYFLKNN